MQLTIADFSLLHDIVDQRIDGWDWWQMPRGFRNLVFRAKNNLVQHEQEGPQ